MCEVNLDWVQVVGEFYFPWAKSDTLQIDWNTIYLKQFIASLTRFNGYLIYVTDGLDFNEDCIKLHILLEHLYSDAHADMVLES